jgi:hypothetical protein
MMTRMLGAAFVLAYLSLSGCGKSGKMKTGSDHKVYTMGELRELVEGKTTAQAEAALGKPVRVFEITNGDGDTGWLYERICRDPDDENRIISVRLIISEGKVERVK